MSKGAGLEARPLVPGKEMKNQIGRMAEIILLSGPKISIPLSQYGSWVQASLNGAAVPAEEVAFHAYHPCARKPPLCRTKSANSWNITAMRALSVRGSEKGLT